jgi:hypothetical protein
MRVLKPGPDREVPRGVVGGAEISQATAGALNIYTGVVARDSPHEDAVVVPWAQEQATV